MAPLVAKAIRYVDDRQGGCLETRGISKTKPSQSLHRVTVQ